MFNESMQGISVLSYALLNSAQDIINSNTFEQVDEDRSQFISKEGDIYFPMSEGIELGKRSKNMPTFMVDGDDTEMRWLDFNDFQRKYISSSITTISYNKSVCLPTLLKRLAMDEKTYGVVIQKGNFVVNPLHPLVAFSVTSGMMDLPEEGELHIFEWSEFVLDKIQSLSENGLTKHKERKEFYEEEYKMVFSLFKYLIKTPVVEKRIASIDDRGIKEIIDSPLIDDINIEININVSSGESSVLSKIKSIIVPTQLAISNIVTPYYGMMLLTDPRGNNTGWNVSPMMSGNLNQGLGDGATFGAVRSRTDYGNICTGSESSINTAGWSTLSKVNLNSMFVDELVSTKGLISFVETSKEISGVIWEGVESQHLADLEKLEEAEETKRTILVEEDE